MFHGDDIVEIAMQLELNGKAFYTAAAAKAQAVEVKALFEELAVQEQLHYDIFKRLLGNVSDIPPANLTADESEIYLQAMLANTFFQKPDAALTRADQIRDDRHAIDMAIDFEKETLLFYYDLRDSVLESQRGLVDRIIVEEKRHIQRLAGQI